MLQCLLYVNKKRKEQEEKKREKENNLFGMDVLKHNLSAKRNITMTDRISSEMNETWKLVSSITDDFVFIWSFMEHKNCKRSNM